MRRYELKSTMVTSNRPLEDWGKLLGDVPSATAILDRLLDRAELIAVASGLPINDSIYEDSGWPRAAISPAGWKPIPRLLTLESQGPAPAGCESTVLRLEFDDVTNERIHPTR